MLKSIALFACLLGIGGKCIGGLTSVKQSDEQAYKNRQQRY